MAFVDDTLDTVGLVVSIINVLLAPSEFVAPGEGSVNVAALPDVSLIRNVAIFLMPNALPSAVSTTVMDLSVMVILHPVRLSLVKVTLMAMARSTSPMLSHLWLRYWPSLSRICHSARMST